MTIKYAPVTVRVLADDLNEIDRLAALKSVDRSDIIRAALRIALPYIADGVAPNLARGALVSEYNQVVLELLAQRYFPDELDNIFDVAQNRLQQFHTAPGSPVAIEAHQEERKNALG